MGLPLDESLEGREGHPFALEIERGKVREFARATRSTNLAYVGSDAIIPPTFLATSAFWQSSETNPFLGVDRDLAHTLHGEQEYIFYDGLPAVGDALTGVVRIERVFSKPGKRGGQLTFSTVVTEYRDNKGKLIAEARATYIQTSRVLTG